MLRVLAGSAVAALVVAVACGTSSGKKPKAGALDAGPTGGTGGQPTEGGMSGSAGGGGTSGGDGGIVVIDGGNPDPYCSCAPGPHNDLIYVASDFGEIWSFDPATDQFDFVVDAKCGTNGRTFSMAIDPIGKAWLLYLSSNDIQTMDLLNPTGCGDPGYAPSGPGGFEYFGMSFAANSATDLCSNLYIHSYSGSGPFSEGPGIGQLGIIDPEMPAPMAIGPIDFDGGELAGTGDGRLFAFAGPDPAKLIEYDKTNASVISTTVLDGFSKTNASAFAFFGGDIYFFNETRSLDCQPCIDMTCKADYDACVADSMCKAELDCAFNQFDITDECGGLLPAPVQTCVFQTCGAECFPAPTVRVSQATKMDFDESDGPGKTMTLVNPQAPIRIVGAGSSVCVPIAIPK